MPRAPFHLRSFRYQTALLFGTVVVLLAAALTALLAQQMAQHIRRDRGAALAVLAQNVATLLHEGLRDRSRQVQLLASTPELWAQGLDSPAVRQALARARDSRADAAWLGVADPSGIVRAATDGLLLGQSVAARPWFQAGVHRGIVGDVHAAQLLASLLPKARSGEPLRFVDFAAPIMVDGRVVGVVGLHGNWEWADTVVQAALPRHMALAGIEVFIRARDGSLLYPRTPSASVDDAVVAAALGVQQGAEPAVVAAGADGRAYLASAAAVAEPQAGSSLGWTVVVRQPTAVAYADARDSALTAGSIGLVAALLAGGLAWLAAGVISRPLSGIAAAARAVGAGDHRVRIPVCDGNEELATLSEALAHMTQGLLNANDAAERRVAERTQALRQMGAEQHAMLDNELVAIVRLKERRVVWKNRALDRMFGTEPGELEQQTLRMLYPDDESFERTGREAYALLAAGGRYRAQLPMRRKDGAPLWVDLSGTLLSADSGESLWLMTDITELKQHQQRVEHIAFHDALTGLPNRLLLADRLQQALALNERTGQQLALCYVDLDGFKRVNDEQGHDAGDELLRVVAQRLQAGVRANDTVARLGGDEFVVLLTSMDDAGECRHTVERLALAIDTPVPLPGGAAARVSASIGVALSPRQSVQPAQLMRLADEAMYRAKHAGKNRVCLPAPEAQAT